MPIGLRQRRNEDDDLAGGLRRCSDCGGAFRIPVQDRDLVAACSCPSKQGMKARARLAGYSVTRRDEVDELSF
jgi:hypothetical protein